MPQEHDPQMLTTSYATPLHHTDTIADTDDTLTCHRGCFCNHQQPCNAARINSDPGIVIKPPFDASHVPPVGMSAQFQKKNTAYSIHAHSVHAVVQHSWMLRYSMSIWVTRVSDQLFCHLLLLPHHPIDSKPLALKNNRPWTQTEANWTVPQVLRGPCKVSSLTAKPDVLRTSLKAGCKPLSST